MLPFYVIIIVWREKEQFKRELNMGYERIFHTQKLIRKSDLGFLKEKIETLTGCPL